MLGIMSEGRGVGAGARLLFASIVCVVGVIMAGSAAALTQYYSELITSEDSLFLPSDVSMTLTSDSLATPGAVANSGQRNGSGLGDGYVGANDVVVYNHTFTAPSNATIIGASLAIATIDDQWWDRNESVAIGVDGVAWANGSAWLSIFFGNIAAGLFEVDGQLQITMVATKGDFNLIGSLFRVVYEVPDTSPAAPTAVNAVPEPGGMALFCTGIVIFGALRRRVFGGRSSR